MNKFKENEIREIYRDRLKGAVHVMYDAYRSMGAVSSDRERKGFRHTGIRRRRTLHCFLLLVGFGREKQSNCSSFKKNGEEAEETMYLAPVCAWLGPGLRAWHQRQLHWTENGKEGDGDREETICFR